MRTLAGAPIAVCATLVLAACGGSADPAAAPIETVDSVASLSAPTTSTPIGAEGLGNVGVGTTGACDRVTPSELSAAFDVTFLDGREIADGQCAFDSDGSPQVLIAVYSASAGVPVCEAFGSEFETVEIAGQPGFWDERGAQARVCLADGSIAATLYGGGGDNSLHRAALIDLVARATTR